MTHQYIYNCVYNKTSDEFCPVFLVSQILEEAEPSISERQKILEKVHKISVIISLIELINLFIGWCNTN